jgi:outer membrane protein
MKKILSSVLIACFLLGGAVMVQPGKVSAAKAPSSVGVVDFGLLVNQHPDMQKANEIFKAETEQAKKEFDTKAASLSDKEKRELDRQLTQRVVQKRDELLSAIADKVNAAVKAVADANGLTMVVPKNLVVYGGTDITDEVMKKITGK